MKAGILAIGNELLDGLVLDTNTNWLELQLAGLGVEMQRIAAVRDDFEEISAGLDFLMESSDVIITSGGLGPTHDDLTLAAIANKLHLPLEENPEALAIVKRQYKTLAQKKIVQNAEITAPRRKMAQIPAGSVPLDNRVGGAPGVRFDLEKTTIFCLPGVPTELKFIFESSVHPWLQMRARQAFVECIVEFEFRDESVFSPFIDSVMRKHEGVYIKSLPRQYGTTHVLRVWISARGTDDEPLHRLVSDAIASLAAEVGQTPKLVEIQ
ncbi:MAG: competence/damage-inducible protein A, partial [Candidatus Thorarchaeota archaeon]